MVYKRNYLTWLKQTLLQESTTWIKTLLTECSTTFNEDVSEETFLFFFWFPEQNERMGELTN